MAEGLLLFLLLLRLTHKVWHLIHIYLSAQERQGLTLTRDT